MAFNVGTLEASSAIDQSGFKNALSGLRREGDVFTRDFQRSLKRISTEMSRVGRTMTTRLTLPIVAFGAASAKLAVDAEEVANKFDVVFGPSADRARERIEELTDTIPLTSVQMQGMASSLQDMLVPMGLARAEAANLSLDMVQVAGDIASFNNVATEDALQAFQSALAGMSQPLRRFGIDVSVSRLEAIALEEGIISVGQEFDSTARAQAIMAAITRDSADAMGDAARTVDSAANQMRFLRRDVRSLMEELGEELIPVIRQVVPLLRDKVNAFRDLSPEMRTAVIRVAAIAAAMGPLLIVSSSLIRATITLTTATRTLNAALLANPYVAITAGVLSLGAAMTSLRRSTERANEAIQQALSIDPTGTSEELERVRNALLENQKEIDRLTKARRFMNVEQREGADRELKALNETRQELIAKIQEVGRGIVATRRQTEATEEQTESVSDLINEVSAFINAVSALNDDLDQTEAVMKRISDTAFMKDFAADDASVDLDIDTSPAEGSIAHYEAILRGINEQIRQTNDETWRHAQMVQRDSIQAQIDELYRLENVSMEVGDALQSVVTTAISDFATTLGDAFTGDAGASGFFNNILMIVADFGEQLGRSLVAAGIAAKSFQMLLSNPVAAIAAGGALIATSRIVKNLLASGPATSVNDALITSSGDVIKFHPDDNILAMKDFSALGAGMTQMPGTGTQRIIVDVRGSVKGSDIAFITERIQQEQSRTGRR